MNEAVVGRVLPASLHQGIADLLPSRLDFYEEWLNPKAMRDGRIGLAPLAAVLSFLRREGDSYQSVCARAGEYAAEWTYADLSPLNRTVVTAGPMALRLRFVGRVVRRMTLWTYSDCRATIRWNRLSGTVGLTGSLFCVVREVSEGPLCEYYSSAVRRLLELSGIAADVTVEQCRATGASRCGLVVTVRPS